MSELCNFHFYSENEIEGEKNTIEFKVKGYKNTENGKVIYYFNHDHKYKFIIENEILEVSVDESKYLFCLNKKTEALIINDGYCFNASIFTEQLYISSDELHLDYNLDFGDFKGNYVIILKLY